MRPTPKHFAQSGHTDKNDCYTGKGIKINPTQQVKGLAEKDDFRAITAKNAD
jgi:hypothetical protein